MAASYRLAPGCGVHNGAVRWYPGCSALPSDLDQGANEMTQGRPIPVSQYDLSGKGVRIAFRVGPEGAPTLEYNGRIFRGDELRYEQTAIGSVASAVLETIPDLHTISLSLAVPDANRPADARAVPVRTFAVFTTERTSIGGPGLVTGQLQEYELVSLTGEAC
jgi:hypothetical protein